MTQPDLRVRPGPKPRLPEAAVIMRRNELFTHNDMDRSPYADR